jgi:sugar O-acyltransferase (sialic acid O-acetyltransferase NeuD family)
LYIIGAGGFGREVADSVREINRAAPVASGPDGPGGEPTGAAPPRSLSASGPFADGPVYRIAGFVDDDESLWGKAVNDIEVKGGVAWLRDLAGGDKKTCAVMAIGDPGTKKIIAQKLDGSVEWATIIHPTAVISPYAVIGAGTVIQMYAIVGPNVQIGRHCCINSCSGAGHDAVLGDYVSVMSHCDITGYDVLEDGVYVATSVAIVPGVTVGEGAFIGAGSVVLKNIPKEVKALGYPAKQIERQKQE